MGKVRSQLKKLYPWPGSRASPRVPLSPSKRLDLTKRPAKNLIVVWRRVIYRLEPRLLIGPWLIPSINRLANLVSSSVKDLIVVWRRVILSEASNPVSDPAPNPCRTPCRTRVAPLVEPLSDPCRTLCRTPRRTPVVPAGASDGPLS